MKYHITSIYFFSLLSAVIGLFSIYNIMLVNVSYLLLILLISLVHKLLYNK